MNIGMILDNDFPPDRRVENEATLLSEYGYNVYLLCFSFNKKETKKFIYKKINVYRFYLPRKVFNLLSPLAFSFPFYHFLLKYYIKRFSKLYQVDVIHVHDMVAMKSVLNIKSLREKNIILDLHENRAEIMKYYSHVHTFPGKVLINLKIWKKKQKEYIQKASKIIVVTEEAKKDIAYNYRYKEANDIITVPNTTRLNNFKSYHIEDKIVRNYQNYFTILYLGAIGIRRGLDTAIQGIFILREKIKNVKLLVIGTGKDKLYLDELIKELKLNDKVHFTGWQDFSLFPSYIKASKIGICPLKRNRHHDTTYANKIFHYMSLGLPVVVSDCPAQAKLIRECRCGMVHEAGNYKDFAENILTLYNNDTLRKKMGENGEKAVIEKYNWEETGKSLINLYNSINLINKTD